MNFVLPGRRCLSIAGRDKGRCFVILELQEAGFVAVADGSMRKTNRPKRKKIKHLKMMPEIMENLQAQRAQDPKALDAKIRNWLQQFCNMDEENER